MAIFIRISKEVVIVLISVGAHMVVHTSITYNAIIIKKVLKMSEDICYWQEESGYINYRNIRDNMRSTLHRMLVSLYADYGEIRSEFNENEVDHIDDNKSNNCITNLQILSKQDNIRKRDGKSYKSIVSNEKLLMIDDLIKKLPSYVKAEKSLSITSANTYRMIESELGGEHLKVGYLDYYSNILKTNKKYNTIQADVDLEVMKLFNNHVKKIDMYFNERSKRFKERIIYNNVMQLNRYRQRNIEFDKYLIRHNIMDNDYESHKNIKKNGIGVYRERDDVRLLQFYSNMNLYIYHYGNLIVRYHVDAYASGNNKYNAYREMKALLFIKHIKTKTIHSHDSKFIESIGRTVKFYRKRKNNISSTYVVNYFNTELLKESYKYVIEEKKSLLDKTKKRRRFLVEEELGTEIADKMYNSEWFKLNPAYEENKKRAKEDIILFIKHNPIIQKQGYFLVDDIVDFIKNRNEKRKELGTLYNPIYKNFDKFVRDLLNYNSDVRSAMKEMKCGYVRANKEIAENVRKYWIDYDNEKIAKDIRRGKKIIVLIKFMRKKLKKRRR